MKTKKCMWCLKEFETGKNESYCSSECESKSRDLTESKKEDERKGFFSSIIDAITGLF